MSGNWEGMGIYYDSHSALRRSQARDVSRLTRKIEQSREGDRRNRNWSDICDGKMSSTGKYRYTYSDDSG